MNTIREISAIAFGIVILSLINWLAGDRSFRGRSLVIRRGTSWIASRWLGLGLWSASVVAITKDDVLLAGVGLAGAIILLIGTARKSAEVPAKES